MLRISSVAICALIISLQAWSQDTFWHHTSGPGQGQDVRSLASNSQGTLFAGTWTAGEVYKTTDNGDSWAVCGAIPNTNPILGLAVSQHDYIFASVFLRGVARSTDDGASWQMKNIGLTNVAVRGSLVDKLGNVWVASEGGLFRSTNEGETWTNMKSGAFYDVWLDSTNAIVSQTGDGAGQNVICRSAEYGTSTWSATTTTGIGMGGIHADGSYYGYSPQAQIFRSTDFGATWTDMHSPVQWDGYTAKMMFTPQGETYYARDGDAAGVLRSTDNGTSWQVKNSGLTTTRVIPLFYHPNGYLFLGTNGAGVFRSSEPALPPQDITVSLPTVITATGTQLEIPVNVTSVSGWGICAYEFTLTFNDPDSILTFDATPVTTGTLSGANGWAVLVNTNVPNKITVGAYGAIPLSGQGPLVKLLVRSLPASLPGDSSKLTISHFLFNSGDPAPAIHNGNVTIHERVCGDADENGLVQAYDAALTLRDALGPMSPPPPPLTSMGQLNADVTMDGKVQPYDAALILRHAIGLPMPESTATCFGTGGGQGSPRVLALSGSLLEVHRGGDQTVVRVQLTDVPANMPIYSYAFDVTCTGTYDNSINLTLPTLPESYMATVNRLENGHFKLGIINPYGVDLKAIILTLSAQIASSLDEITFSGILVNDLPSSPVTLKNITTGIGTVEPTPVQPTSYDLIGAYPNPFNPSTRIAFQTKGSEEVNLEIYSPQGVRIKVLLHEQMGAGTHEISWNGTNELDQSVASGQYFCVLRAGSYLETIRLILLK